jgi:siroheme synthase-like protein
MTSLSHLYPVMLDLSGRRVLVIGGGIIALRKTEALLEAGALVTAISPDFNEGWMALADTVAQVVRRYQPNDGVGYWLVVTATNDPIAQQQVFDDCQRNGIWVNAADDPERCSFILPAVHRDGPVIVSVSTSGSAPALAGWIRDRLARALPPQIGRIALQLRRERDAVHDQGQTTEGMDWLARIETLVADD